MIKYIFLAIVGLGVMVYSVTVPISFWVLVATLLGMGVFGWSALEILIWVLDWLLSEDDGGERK